MDADHWDALFGAAGLTGVREAFSGGEPVVVHGARDRLPHWMHHESLRSAAALCATYSGRILHGRRDRGPRSTLIERGSATDLLAAGEALYLPDIDKIIYESIDWIINFEKCLGIPKGSARVTAWVAPAGEGTALHLDAEDVISVQLSGRKTFEVAEPAALPFPVGFQYGPGIPAAADLYPQAAGGFPDPTPAQFTSLELEPGSVLVLPRGHWHRTRCSEVSLSLSIVTAPPTRMDWALGMLRHGALQDARWRQPLYGAPTVDQRTQIATGFAALVRHLAEGPGDWAWCDTTALQRVPSVTLDPEDPSHLIDHYDGTRRPVAATPLMAAVLRWLGSDTSVFTVAQARTAVGAGVEVALEGLIQNGMLYRWPGSIVRPL